MEALPTTERDAIRWLIGQVPELAEVHVAGVYLADGQVLAYVLFQSGFTRWFAERMRAGELEPAQRFTAAIEALLAAPNLAGQVRNLVGVAFVEALVMHGDRADVVTAARPWLGPATARELDVMRANRERLRGLPPDEW